MFNENFDDIKIPKTMLELVSNVVLVYPYNLILITISYMKPNLVSRFHKETSRNIQNFPPNTFSFVLHAIIDWISRTLSV